MSQLLKSSGAMAVATLTSRILGMVREMVYARFMGDGWVAGAFQVAFTMPNLFRRLLGEGALTAAFIPIFKQKERSGDTRAMWQAANAVISGLIVAAAVIIALVLLGVSLALEIGAWEARVHLMLSLLRIMFPYMLPVCLTAVLMGMLNARGYFFIPAMGATMLNVVMIAFVLWVAPRWGHELHEQIYALAWGVLVAGLAQAAFQWPALHREGFRYQWVPPWRDPTVREVVRRMVPGAIGVAAFHINVMMVQMLGLWVDQPGAPVIAPYNYAVRLMELPQGVFGISVATYLLPTLSGLAASKDWQAFRHSLRHGIGHLLVVNTWAAVMLVVLAEPIIRLLFEGRRFGPDATLRAAWALQFLAPSLVAYSVVNVLARAFYALDDTFTPMRISIVCLTINLALSLLLVFPLRQAGFGLANTMTSALNAALLAYALRKKLRRLDWNELRRAALRLIGIALITAVITGLVWHWTRARWSPETLSVRIGQVFVPAVFGTLAYALLAWAARLPLATEMAALVQSFLSARANPGRMHR
ncbi:murein biosynthesis integral membrane protein MurJ [Limisphaera ngatamarikiensis]|uniref:Probable lipid II flippase MurJ n=1 Tax=Limisphaera ngatamarikiensis TaxID=1324935 RepID=A0A6M1RXJ7_9BACT|nr:murein biosynthesis integral membrane protein MurJ [Limisphaera ngatamarikiensis]NGO40054.1 murein biosynthesis integral membrane protein MurJ [Limisphaera ngatamarikiensis]